MAQTRDDLEQAFRLYFAEMDRCATAGHYFALLHVIAALPDVCAALEDPAKPVAERYEAWYARYHHHEFLSAVEFYDFRCKLLHQGQAVGRGRGRYKTYSFAVHPGISMHRAVLTEANITLDPRLMAVEKEAKRLNASRFYDGTVLCMCIPDTVDPRGPRGK